MRSTTDSDSYLSWPLREAVLLYQRNITDRMYQTILKPEQKESDAFRTIDEVISSRGFVCESHKVKTDDGYRLTVHRVVNPQLPSTTFRQPVLIQHGFTSNSIHWLIATPDGHLSTNTGSTTNSEEEQMDLPATEEKMTSNLGFALAKAGFDVWLGNFRGNRYALEHETLSPDDNAFWDFSLDDFIEYDLPSTINYILATTGQGSYCVFKIDIHFTNMFFWYE